MFLPWSENWMHFVLDFILFMILGAPLQAICRDKEKENKENNIK